MIHKQWTEAERRSAKATVIIHYRMGNRLMPSKPLNIRLSDLDLKDFVQFQNLLEKYGK